MDMQTEDSHVTMGAETGVLQLQAKSTEAAGNTQKLREKMGSPDTLIPDF